MADTPNSPPNSPIENSPKAPRGLLYGIGAIILLGILFSFYARKDAEVEPIPASTPVSVVTSSPTSSPSESAVTSGTAPDLTTDEAGLSKAVVTIETNKGVIKYRFYPNDAPHTVARMIELIRSGFYNGLTFHRVVPDFVIQGGDPQGNGTGGSGQKLKAEFNKRKHVPGAVAMARAQDPDSADSQFYITLGTIPHLDDNYTVFGQVIEGQEIVKQIAVGDKMTKVTVN
jgi:cyclophilin family peptidyl-prolyl cis-trans isomerase